MQEVLGKHTDDADFDRYLAGWRTIMTARIAQAVASLAAVEGVRGLILAGSNGIGQPWPLSDIDVIPVYADHRLHHAAAEVEQVRNAALEQWSTQGWRTGLDIGRLHFRAGELTSAFAHGSPDPVPLLADDRWYHSIDKAYGGRAVHDPDGLAAPLAAWFTANRFEPAVVAERLDRSAREVHASIATMERRLGENDLAASWGALLKAIQWRQIHLMERWGERDNSLGRFGSRFALIAERHGFADHATALDDLAMLDATSVTSRLAQAPAWVHERNDRSWKARQAVCDPVSRLESDRDVLRVCTIYGLRDITGPPYPGWLAIPDPATLRDRAATLGAMLPGHSQGCRSRVSATLREPFDRRGGERPADPKSREDP